MKVIIYSAQDRHTRNGTYTERIAVVAQPNPNRPTAKPKLVTQFGLRSSLDDGGRKKAVLAATSQKITMTQTDRLGIRGVIIDGYPSFLQDGVEFVPQGIDLPSFKELLTSFGIAED